MDISSLYFSLNKGYVEIPRVDLLINERFPIAAWGNVDIDGNGVDMVIGLLGASIKHAFKVPGIPNRYMHTPCEMVSLQDLENTYKLFAYAVEQIDDNRVYLKAGTPLPVA